MTATITPDEIDYTNPPFQLSAIDRAVLATKDEDFHRITWDDLHEIIGISTATNTLATLKRVPSDLRRYLAWSHTVKRTHGGVVPFVLSERLHWSPQAHPDGVTQGPYFPHHSSTPFADRRDYAVLFNDWPYAFAPGITHLVVWSKTPIAVDPGEGDVTAESRAVIEDFVQRYFVQALGGDRERVQWFKNWVSLQSVRGVDHVHVLVKNVDDAMLEKWTERMDL